MTNFTKQELIEIQEFGRHSVELWEKIQAMIDNYCEHDCKLTIWQCQVTACSKCGFPSTLKVQGK